MFRGFAHRCTSLRLEKCSDNLVRQFLDLPRWFDLILLKFVVIIVAVHLRTPLHYQCLQPIMYPRTVIVRSKNGSVNEYVRVVEAYRDNGKVKQRVVADLGRKDLLIDLLPKLRRLLEGDAGDDLGNSADPRVVDASTWGPILVLRALFHQLGLWAILDQHLGHA